MRKRLEKYLKEINYYCLEDIVEDIPPAVESVVNYYRGLYDDDGAWHNFWTFLSTGLYLDGNVEWEESRFINEIIGKSLPHAHIAQTIKDYAVSESTFMKEYNTLPYQVKADIVYLMISACAVDGCVSSNENSFLRRLLRTL